MLCVCVCMYILNALLRFTIMAEAIKSFLHLFITPFYESWAKKTKKRAHTYTEKNIRTNTVVNRWKILLVIEEIYS